MDERPIGIFDSGFGGLTVARAMIDLLPAEDIVYLGDTGRYPYGSRDQREVACFARQITTMLVKEHDVKMVVVACNTAAAAALDRLRDEFDVPIIGVIEPGLRSAVHATATGRVGVIGTVGTIASGAYQRAAAELASGFPGSGNGGSGIAGSGIGRAALQLTCAACPGFVEFVERGDTGSDQVFVLAERLLEPIRRARVDTLLLGCTHYPFLARTISDVVGRHVVLVSSADETAFAVREALAERAMGRWGDHCGERRWISSGDVATFAALGRRLFGPEIDRVESWDPGC